MDWRGVRFFAGMLVLVCGLCAAQNIEPWLPISAQDLQLKSVSLTPGASAVQLYFSYYKDDNAKFISVYKRIKILSDVGRKYADVEIPLEPQESLKELKARTIRPDGTTVDFQGKTFEKTVVKTRFLKYTARTFTLPEANVGSIVEYSYLITLPRGVVDEISEWPLQSELFTVKERMRFRAFQGLVNVPTERRMMPKTDVGYTYLNMPPTTLPQKKQGNLMELELENMPAFHGEDYMPPEGDYRPAVLFYYGGREQVSPDKFWQTWQKLLSDYDERFIGNSRVIREAAAQAVGNEQDGEKKLRRLYARAQQVRNLSYERERSADEEKAEHLKDNNSAQEVLQHGYGTSWEIDALFVAMARAAGFDASIALVSSRRERSFKDVILWLGQFDGQMAMIKLNGKEIALDPGTKFNPYGILSWVHTGVTALSCKPGAEFITSPEPQGSPMRRSATVKLAGDGSGVGEITVEFEGQEALEHRLEAFKTDEAGRRKSLEDEIKAWLPNGATVRMTESKGWEETDGALIAKFSIEIPSLGSMAGKRFISGAYLFPTRQASLFTDDTRLYPIAFAYPYSEDDQIKVEFPEGFALEQPPYARKVQTPYASYEFAVSSGTHDMTIHRSLRLDGVSFPTDKYFELKNFFSIVKAGDTSQLVLRSGAGF